MFIEDIKREFIMWVDRCDKRSEKKLGDKLETGEYSPIYPQKKLIFVNMLEYNISDLPPDYV